MTEDEALDAAVERAGHPSELTEMPRGWPRPHTHHRGQRLPIPYIAKGRPSDVDLGNASAMRRALCVLDRRCQVCGDRLGDLSVVVAPADRPDTPYVTDGAAIHPDPCWRAARRLCPHLATMATDGVLLVWTVPTSDLQYHDDEDDNGPQVLRPRQPPDPLPDVPNPR